MRRAGARRLALATALLGSALALGAPGTSTAATPARAAASGASPTASASRTAASPTAPATPPTQPASSRAAAGTSTSGLAVSLQQVSPTVAAEGEDTTVTATVRNTSGRQLTGVVVGVRQAVASMTSRKQVAGWAASSDPADGSLLASESVAGALAPGASTRVAITVPDVGAGRAATYGTVGVSIDAVAGTAYGRQHTFLGYQRIKQYQPLRFAVAIPLVLDANAALSGTSSGRAAAWQAVTGPGSRLDRILGATEGHDVSWILDPQLVQPPHIVEPATAGEEPSQTSSTTVPTPTPTASAPSTPVSDLAYAASSAELSDREELAARILAGTAQHPTVLLPAGDPDIVALAGGPTDTVRSLVDDASSGVAGLHATADVAWPADGSWSGGVEAAARAAYGPSLEGALVDSRWTTSTPATPTAAHRSADDLPLVVYDDTDSTLLGAATSRTAASVATQQLVADTAAIVTERPGTTRTVAVVAPRALDPDPTGLDRMLDALDEVPWISPASLTSAFEEARADTGVARVAQPQELPAATRSPLTPPVAAAIRADVTSVRAMASVRDDGTTFAPPWQQAAVRLAAASWRTERGGFAVLRTALHAAGSTAGLEVSPREVNFLADSGRVQITVVNTLRVGVHDVTLTLRPDNPRLRVDTPRVVLRIGARSRTTVTFKVTAYAAGLVPITTTLSAPDGTVIRSDAPVRIRVSPTGHWIYWVIGVVAAGLLVAGIWRGRIDRRRVDRRRGARGPVAEPDEDVSP